MKLKTLLLLFLSCYFLSCKENIINTYEKPHQAYVPIYKKELNKDTILFEKSHAVIYPDSVIEFNNLRFQVDKFYGIHIYEKHGINDLEEIGFYAIDGCTKLIISNNILSTNYFRDSIAIDFHNLTQPEIISHSAEIYKNVYQERPPYPGFFECVEAEKGTVIGWILKFNDTAICRY